MIVQLRSVCDWFKDLLRHDSGQDLVEYALLTTLISLALITAMGDLATWIGSAFTTVGSSM